MSLSTQLDMFYQSEETVVYLIHLFGKVGKCQHYIGSTIDLERRLKQHRYKRKKGGSPLLREANKRGIVWHVARTWKATRAFEMKLKRQKNHKRFCPICQEEDLPF